MNSDPSPPATAPSPGARSRTPSPRLEPELRTGLRVRPLGITAASSVPVYVHRDLLEELLRHARSRRQGGGLLTGSYGLGQRGAFVELSGFEAAGPAGSTTELVERLDDERRYLSVEEETVVGWFHLRVAPGPAPTPQDLLAHARLMNSSWQVMVLGELRSGRIVTYQVLPAGPQDTGLFVVEPRG